MKHILTEIEYIYNTNIDNIQVKIRKNAKKVHPVGSVMYNRTKYKREVQRLTELQPLHLLEHYDKRGYKSFHVDHIVSIWDGYYNNIPAKLISDISNLRMLPYEENKLKGKKSCIVRLLEMIERTKTLYTY